MPRRTWLVTGCSTGFGRSLSERLLAAGDRVVMTARDRARVEDIATRYPDTARALTLDITESRSTKPAVKELEAQGWAIDILVNNAGYALFGGIEEATQAQIRAIFETNFFGALEMMRAVLPGMRARRAGRIINISSMAGISGGLALGHYAATKFALAAVSESLALEAAHLGIRVTIVEPGAHRTAVKQHWQIAEPIDDYADSIGRARIRIHGEAGREPGDPERVTDAIIAIADAADPPLHLPLGTDALARLQAKLERAQRETEAWRDLIVSTTIP
jgi:NAD(P)-dependent dehydrogenase (short-subunit alcohol dehydrogenase family)